MTGIVLAEGVVAISGLAASTVTNMINTAMEEQLNSGLGAQGITVTGSPFTYQNVSGHSGVVLVSGGTVTTISYSRDGIAFFPVGLLGGMFHLSPEDYLRVVYILAPTMTFIPF